MRYIFIIICFFIISCVTTGGNYKKESYSKIDELISEYQFEDAEEYILDLLEESPLDKNLAVLYSFVLFKGDRFQSCYSLTDEILKDRTFFRSLPNLRKSDLFYYHLISSVNTGNFDKSSSIYNNYVSQFKSPVDKVKQAIIFINNNLVLENYSDAVSSIKEIQKRFRVNSDLSLNLSYLEAYSYYKMGKYEMAIDLISSISEYKLQNGYLYKIKELLDRVVERSEETIVETYKNLLINSYNNLLDMSSDFTFSDKIKRSIYSLNAEDISISLDTKADDTSALTLIRVLPGENKTGILFGSNDSIKYSDLNYDESKNLLTFTIEDKNLNYNSNRIDPPKGVGVTEFSWLKSRGDLHFSIKLEDDYEISVEKLYDNFEKNKNASDRYQLLLSIDLPTTAYSMELATKKDGDYTIVLDPGHGGDDCGALSVMKRADGRKYYEKDMNLLLSIELKKYLEKRGYNVFLTRTADYYPDLVERTRIALQRDADMFLSIHMNSASRRRKARWQKDDYIGVEMIVRNSLGSVPEFINKDNFNKSRWIKERKRALKEHRKLSDIFQSTIRKELDPPFNRKRTLKKRNLKIFSGMTIPHALIETGFIINNRNLKYLLKKEGRNKLYKGILKGIEKYRKTLKK
ncbi:MAG: hypothetical protein CR982_08955 [Candidatus Cloacimonadota bacterium]|nr:MAG: hypothetical protein CR982_08955 [Candidatus Cloacimonadota bacterium]PIE78594.1 MAG: hypothetical protein CSA15_06850 [Candidatus Delongbacteria bacterium]